MPFEGTMKSRGSSFSLKRPDGGTRAAFRRLWSCRPACVLNFTLCFLLASRRMPDLSSAAAISRGRGGPWISRWRWPTQSIWLRSFFFANEFTRLCAVRCPFSPILPGTLELFFLWDVVILLSHDRSIPTYSGQGSAPERERPKGDGGNVSCSISAQCLVSPPCEGCAFGCGACRSIFCCCCVCRCSICCVCCWWRCSICWCCTAVACFCVALACS